MPRIDHAENLLRTAELLLSPMLDGYAPRHRAVSTGYYAVFHTLQFFIAQSSLGKDVPENDDDFEEHYRKLEHYAFGKKKSNEEEKNNDRDIKLIFDNCRILKKARHDADYRVPLKLNLSRSSAAKSVLLARETVQVIRCVAADSKKLASLVKILLAGNNKMQKKRSP